MDKHENDLLAEFQALKSVSRARNGVSQKIVEFLQSERGAKKSITKLTASQFSVEKIHVQALYTALKSMKIDLSNKAVKKTDEAHYFSEAIVKL